MLRKTGFLILATIIYSLSFGQDSKFMAGVEIIPSITTFRLAKNAYTDNQFFFSGGLTCTFSINPQAAFKSGLTIMSMGTQHDAPVFNSQSYVVGYKHITTNAHYLVMPLLASTTSEGRTKVFLDFGPWIGLLLSAKSKVSSFADDPARTYNITSTLHKLYLGLTARIGLSIPVNKNLMLDIAAKGDLGLTSTRLIKGYNRPVSLGLLFGLKYKL